MPNHDHDLKGKKTKAAPQDIPQPSLASLTRFYTAAGADQRLGDIADRLETIMRELGAVVRQGGGFIGHIKAFLSFTEGGSIGMSVVKDKVEHQPFDQSAENRITGFKLAVTAIVYRFDSEELSRLLSLGLAVGLPESVCRPVQVETQNLKPIAPFGS